MSYFKDIIHEYKVRSSYLSYPKSEPKTYLFTDTRLVRFSWLGLVNLFQTYEDLGSVKDKQADAQAVRRLIDEDATISSDEEVVC